MRLSHSYSAIKLFEQCPERYRRQRITKEFKDEGGAASAAGERIHKMLEKRLKEDETLPQEAARYEKLCQSFINMARIPEGTVDAEVEIVFTENLEITGWWDADAWLRTKVDVLVMIGDLAIVGDWKTGKRYPDFFQMQLYAAAIFKRYPHINKVVTTLVWLKDLTQDPHTFHRNESNELWATVMGKIRRIYDAVETGNWPARPSGLCAYCPARHDCNFAQL